MPQIIGTATEDSGSVITNYTDTATSTTQTFTFSDKQDGMSFTSKGSSIVTLTINGKTNNIPPKGTIRINDEFTSFDVSSSNSQLFEINSFRLKNDPRDVEDFTVQLADIASQVGVSTENKYSYSYNANGDIQTVTEKSKTDVLISTTTYTYKANGDVDTSVKVSGSTTLTTQYIYDANGNLTDTVSVKS
jgi:hypothetical protein